MKLLNTIKTLKVKPCEHCRKVPELICGWDDEWTLLYSKIVEEWNKKFGEGHPPVETSPVETSDDLEEEKQDVMD